MKPITVLIGGDLAPTKSNNSLFSEGDVAALIDESLLSLLSSVEHRIFNLEVPLTDIVAPIKKAGPNLIAPAAAVKGIKLLNPAFLNLANNHIMDQDEQGLFKTIEQLSNHNIRHVGADKDPGLAAKPVFLERDGLKIGIYACAENEFSIANANRAGANPFDPLESPEHISKLKSECNFVIVLYHGGKEHYRYPSPYLQKVCRKIVEKGADLVICQHSHCIGSFEDYLGKKIIYGQGNFLFDLMDNEFWQTSLLIKAEFGEMMTIDFIPICKKGIGVELAASDVKENILKAFYGRSEEISIPGFIETEYEKFCAENGFYYLSTFAGFGKVLRKIDKILNGGITKQIYSLNKLNLLRNYIECEAHRELILRYVHGKIKEK